MELADFKDLPSKIWEIRSEIDSLYKEALSLSPSDLNVHTAYSLALWRIGYDSVGIDLMTTEWLQYNPEMAEQSKYRLSRANAFLNDDKHELALKELLDALRICSKNKEKEKENEMQTRLLMAVTYNKMDRLKEGCSECERILKMPGYERHGAALKMYAAILQRMKRFGESKEVYNELLVNKKDNENVNVLTEYISLLVEMKEYEEAKSKLQIVLSLQIETENRLALMYQFGLICLRQKEHDKAIQIFSSIVAQEPLRMKGAYIHLVEIYKEQIRDLLTNKNSKNSKNSFLLKSKQNECEKYLLSWIDHDGYNKQPYHMLMEHLWSLKEEERLSVIWREWVNAMTFESNAEFEGEEEAKSNEEALSAKKESAKLLLSALYSKYARMLTQKKVLNQKESEDEEKEKESEEIEGYFSLALELNEESMDALQGMAAYYISSAEYMHAVPFLERANALHRESSSTYIQFARLCRTISSMESMESMDSGSDSESVPDWMGILEEGLLVCSAKKEKVALCQELVDKLILFGGPDNMEKAQKHCWLILDEYDKLNVSAMRNIGKVCDDRKRIEVFFENVVREHPTYCPALVEYAQFLSTSKEDRASLLMKAQKMLEAAIDITSSSSSSEQYAVNAPYRCVALYLLGFVKLHRMEKAKGMNAENVRLNNEARELFRDAVKADESNMYARINLAQFLAFKDNEDEEALHHLEFAMNHCQHNEDPNLMANLIKVLAKKAIQNEDDLDMDALRRAFKLCGDALRKYKGHFGLIVARSSLQSIKRKFALIELDDGLDPELVAQQNKPQTTYGMVGVDILNAKHFQSQSQPQPQTQNENDE